MADREKVIKGLECCSQMAGEMCRKCPYANECEEGEGLLAGAAHLAADALSLLKAQEPRVMTLEEVRQMGKRNMNRGKAPCETCVYERRGCIGLTTCSPRWDEPQFEGDQSHLDIQYFFLGTDEYDVVYVKKYGFEIRCWTSRPTDEQRKAVKWDD